MPNTSDLPTHNLDSAGRLSSLVVVGIYYRGRPLLLRGTPRRDSLFRVITISSDWVNLAAPDKDRQHFRDHTIAASLT
jgi:hypothetical protein